jgi:hypothetical protein
LGLRFGVLSQRAWVGREVAPWPLCSSIWGDLWGWGLIFLELLVVTVVWPDLRGSSRVLLMVMVVAFMATHWWALVMTARGQGLQLLTLQSAQTPWETLVVLPLALWLLWNQRPAAVIRFVTQRPLHVR